MKSLGDYICESGNSEVASLKKICSVIEKQCKSDVLKCKKSIIDAFEMADDIYADDHSLQNEIYGILEKMICKVWDAALNEISYPERLNAHSLRVFNRNAEWLLPFIEKTFG